MILDCFCKKTLAQVEKKISDELHILYIGSTTKEEERLIKQIDDICKSHDTRAGAIVVATALFLDKAGYSKAIWDGLSLWRMAVTGVYDSKKSFAEKVLFAASNIEYMHSYGHLNGIKLQQIHECRIHEEFWKVKLHNLNRDEMFFAGSVLMRLSVDSLPDDGIATTDWLSASCVMRNMDEVYGRIKKKKKSTTGKPRSNSSQLRK
jgi:hypothetical protein